MEALRDQRGQPWFTDLTGDLRTAIAVRAAPAMHAFRG
jgi:hypothetical protein